MREHNMPNSLLVKFVILSLQGKWWKVEGRPVPKYNMEQFSGLSDIKKDDDETATVSYKGEQEL